MGSLVHEAGVRLAGAVLNLIERMEDEYQTTASGTYYGFDCEVRAAAQTGKLVTVVCYARSGGPDGVAELRSLVQACGITDALQTSNRRSLLGVPLVADLKEDGGVLVFNLTIL